jgi:predicted transposase YbfD/YdcC
MVRSLLEVLIELHDPRHAKGKRYSLVAVLTIVILALLSNQESIRQMGNWAQGLDRPTRHRLGLRRGKVPSYSTLRRVLLALDPEKLAQALAQWLEQVLAQWNLPRDVEARALAIDGKTLRGSTGDTTPALQVLSASLSALRSVLDSCAVPKETNELGAFPQLLQDLVLEGRVVTLDALYTQREVAQAISQKGGGYVMRVKANQPRLFDALRTWFEQDTWGLQKATQMYEETIKGHGRLVHYTIWCTERLNDHLAWPHLGQAFCIERTCRDLKTGHRTCKRHYGLTSLCAKQANAPAVLRLWRQHWHIENDVHWVKDVVFGEDRSRARTGTLPLALSLFRQLAIALLRLAEFEGITAARSFLSADVKRACSLVGIPLE